MTDSSRLIGHIVRLQVETAHLKRGEALHRWYDPAPITVVDRLLLDGGGVRGVLENGAELEDVHNETHAISRFRGDNGVSIGFTGHYRAMRERFGPHLADGIAGENLLIATDVIHDVNSLSAGLVVETARGQVVLSQIEVAAPCVEFSRFCLRYGLDRKSDRTVTGALQFLHQGMRGFYATAQDAGVVGVGDLVYLYGNQSR